MTQTHKFPLQDTIRPGKIGDLQLTVLKADEQQLLARWTAPGGDFSDGQVMTYRFVYSQKMEELLTPATTAPALDGLKRADTGGQVVSHLINFNAAAADYYVGLYAFDEAGNRGAMSNIVLVNVPPPTHPPNTTGTMEPIVSADTTDWTLIGAIIGAVGVLLLLLVLGLYCHCLRGAGGASSAAGRRGRFNKSAFASKLKSNAGVKVEIPSPPASENTDSSSYESDIKGGNATLVSGIAHPKVRVLIQKDVNTYT